MEQFELKLTAEQYNALQTLSKTCIKSENCFVCVLHPFCGQFRLIKSTLKKYDAKYCKHVKTGKFIT